VPSHGECGGWRVSRSKALSHATKYLVILMSVGGRQAARHQLPLCRHARHTLLHLARFSPISKRKKTLPSLVIFTSS